MKKLYLLLTILIVNSFVYASEQASKPASQQAVLKQISNKSKFDWICNIASVTTMLGSAYVMNNTIFRLAADGQPNNAQLLQILTIITGISVIIGGISGVCSLLQQI